MWSSSSFVTIVLSLQYAVLVMILFVMKIAAIALWFTMKSGVRDHVI